MIDSTLIGAKLNKYVAAFTYCLEYCLTFINIISGACVVTLEKDWFSKIPERSKIPLYILVSLSLSFAVVYIFVDFIEAILECIHFDCCKRPKSKHTPLLISNLQHLILLIATITIGITFGGMYSTNEIEKYY